MSEEGHRTYPPLDTLKPIADEVWIVDGPLIAFGPPGLKMDFPTRMSVVRLAGGDLFVHSPTPLTDALKREVLGIGRVRWLVAPNRIHYWWLPEWKRAFVQAQPWLAPGVRERAGTHIDFACRDFACRDLGEEDDDYPWTGEIETLPIIGTRMSEVVFFHRPSRTLLLTDLIENFEPDKLGSWWERCLTRLGAAQDPDGQMPRDMRLVYRRDTLRRAVQQMIDWDPQRVVLAHGRWYPAEGVAELRRAFRWLL